MRQRAGPPKGGPVLLPHNVAACHMISPRVKLCRVVMLGRRNRVTELCGRNCQFINVEWPQMCTLAQRAVTFMLSCMVLYILCHGCMSPCPRLPARYELAPRDKAGARLPSRAP